MKGLFRTTPRWNGRTCIESECQKALSRCRYRRRHHACISKDWGFRTKDNCHYYQRLLFPTAVTSQIRFRSVSNALLSGTKRRLSTIEDKNDESTNHNAAKAVAKNETTGESMKVFNTMTGSLESLPIHTISKDSAQLSKNDALGLGWYTCGPTTYAPAHLGHARTYVCLDILRRVMTASTRQTSAKTSKPEPLFVLNITDVDDKILAAAKETGEDPIELARRYERDFWRDWDALNCLRPHVVTRVTEHVESDIIPFIERLVEQGMAYEMTATDANAGGVFFDVMAYNKKLGHLTKYGKLAPPSAAQGMEGILARTNSVDVTKPQKKDPRDFVLWKTRPKGQESLSWESPWGYGRPGWHIECSAMIESVQEQFKDTHRFLVHAGGIDLKFPHHTNEIAQSEAYLESGDWIPHWIHTGHLHIDGLKMSKSLKNFVSIEDFLGQTFDDSLASDNPNLTADDGNSSEGMLECPSDDFRLWCLGLSGSYRGPATFSMTRIKEARAVRHKILRFLLEGEAWIRSAVAQKDSTKQWKEDDCSFFKTVDASKRRGLLALENDLDGATFVSELIAIAEHGVKYTQKKRGPVEPLVFAIQEVRDLLRLVGFTEMTTQAGTVRRNDNESSSFGSQVVCLESLVDQLVHFRSSVRNIALEDSSMPGMQKILALSDELRDSSLAQLGLQLIDETKNDKDTWKFCVPRKPTQEVLVETEAKNDPATNNSSVGAMELESIPLLDFFKVGQYEGVFSEYNEHGVPTHNANGSEVSKRLFKKLLKKHEKHKRRLEKRKQ